MNPNPAPPKLYSAYYEWRNDLVWAEGQNKQVLPVIFLCLWWSNTLAFNWSIEPYTVVYLFVSNPPSHTYAWLSLTALLEEKSLKKLFGNPQNPNGEGEMNIDLKPVILTLFCCFSLCCENKVWSDLNVNYKPRFAWLHFLKIKHQ